MKRHGSMNRIYRLVWSQVLNAWVAVAETARGRGKGANRKLLLAATLALSTGLVQAAPTGGQVTSGTGTIGQSGNTTTIQQSTQNLSLNWQSFNIGAQETVTFNQPSATALAVNRIFDTNGSQILGHINANGQVWLINPNGILFGQGAQVNVGSLVASTLNISDSATQSNSRRFSGNGSGSIINKGTINATDGGYVALLGNSVSNQGVINARLGTVALGAGSAATLTFNGNSLVRLQIDQSTLNNLAENRQLIRADGGQVLMSAGARDSLLASVVNNTGVIEARTVENHNGKIVLLGGMAAGTTKVSGTLDASAPTGGNGGFVETSAAKVKVVNDARITTASTLGLTGTWLVDPHDFTVSGSGGDMTGTALSTNLATSNVTLQSSGGGTVGSGNVNINDVVSWSANHILTLTASNDVNFNASITATGTTAGIAINPNTANGANPASGTGTFNLNNGAQINLPNVSTNSTTAFVLGGTPYTVINSLGAAGSTSGKDLQGTNGNLSGHYVLGSNIDAAPTSNWNAGAGFTPISNNTTSFSGSFDGLGHAVTNLSINRPTENYIGLFGAIGSSSTVQNLGLMGVRINGYDNVGSVAGLNNGAIENSFATGSVAGTDLFVGAFVGVNNGTINNSYATGNVTGASRSGNIGGLAGGNNGTISNSHASGNVTANFNLGVGGLVGTNHGTISNSYAAGKVDGTSDYEGGLVGYNNGSIIDSSASGNVIGSLSNQVGGLVGWNYGTVSGSASTGNVSGSWYVGGLVGQNGGASPTGLIISSYAGGSVSGQSYVGGLVGENYSTIVNAHASGMVSGGATVGGLVGRDIGGLVSYSGATGDVTANANYVGGLIGYSYSTTINSSYATGTVNAGAGIVGGLVGWFGYGTASNCYAKGNVINTGVNYDDAGGLLGVNYKASVSNSYAAGNVTSAGNNVGGLVGINDNNTTLNNSYSTGSVSGVNYVGGLVGSNNWGLISNSYSVGSVTSTGSHIGGLTGFSPFGSTIKNSYANVGVTAGPSSTDVGGLVGTNHGEINNSYSAGLVTAGAGSANVGALLGVNTGGAIGALPPVVNNIFWDASVNPMLPGIGLGYMAAATGLTASQMRTASNFGAFNFTTTLGATGNNWVLVDSDGTLNNEGGALGGTRPMLASEYSTVIANAHQLQLMAMDLSASYSMVSNIDAAATNGKDVWSSAGFVPIGSLATTFTGFAGTFDGMGKTISNLVINMPTTGVTGLFSGLAASGEVNNVKLSGGSVSGGFAVGSLVGINFGAISGASSSVAVSGNLQSIYTQGVGGLVGYNYGTVDTSSASGTVTFSNASLAGVGKTGGVVGSNAGSISSSYATGTVNGTFNVGGLAGFSNGSISNAYATGNVTGSGYRVGGLVGYSSGNITNSHASGTVVQVGGSDDVGGLAGGNGGAINNSYATGSVTGTGNSYYVGGLVGDSTGAFAGINNSYASGAVSSNGGYGVGGLVGSNYAAITNSYALGPVSGAGDVGGLVGGNNGAIITSYSTGHVNGNTLIGGLIGVNTAGTVTNSYWNITTSGQSSSAGGVGLTTTAMRSASNFFGFDFLSATPTWVLVDADGSLNNAGGATGSVFPMLASEYSTTITNAHQLQLLAMAPSAIYTLGNNIAAAGTAGNSDVWSTTGFTPIGNSTTRFTGSLNGQGYTISGLTINQPTTNYVGLFGYNNGTLSNLNLSQTSISGNQGAGGLVGLNFGTITQASVSGTVSAANPTSFAGGLVGYNLGTVQGSSSATVNGTTYVGGLIGYNSGTIQAQSASSGSVTGTTYVGGLVGGNAGTGTITSASSSATVTGNIGGFWTGGLVGLNFGTITSATTTGPTSGKLGSGGLTGFNAGTITQSTTSGSVGGSNYVGGLAGYNTGTVQTQSSSNSAVFGTNYIGGLVGYNSGAILTQSSSSGTVNATTYVGGLVGGNDSQGMINQSSSTAGVTGAAGGFWTGGLAGLSFGTITASSASGTIAGNLGVGGLAGLNVGTITQSTAGGSVGGSTYVGGLVGYNAATIQTQSSSNATVSGTNYIGGLVGYNGGTIRTQSSSSGLVSGKLDVGGLVGQNASNGTINQTSSTASVTGTTGSLWTGGLVGLNSGNITASFASGAISANTGVGGLIGFNGGNITQSYSGGNVSGSSYVGGLVGYANAGTIQQSFSTGPVTGTTKVGGLIGWKAGGTVSTDSFWDKNTSNQVASSGSAATAALTTAQAKSQATLSNLGYLFGGNNPWKFTSANSYPRLGWQ